MSQPSVKRVMEGYLRAKRDDGSDVGPIGPDACLSNFPQLKALGWKEPAQGASPFDRWCWQRVAEAVASLGGELAMDLLDMAEYRTNNGGLTGYPLGPLKAKKWTPMTGHLSNRRRKRGSAVTLGVIAGFALMVFDRYLVAQIKVAGQAPSEENAA